MRKRPMTLSVPEAGRKYFGLSRNGSYDAARRGDIPTIKVGRLLLVPVAPLERLFAGRARVSPNRKRRVAKSHTENSDATV